MKSRKSRMETFWYRLTHARPPGKWPLKRRERTRNSAGKVRMEMHFGGWDGWGWVFAQPSTFCDWLSDDGQNDDTSDILSATVQHNARAAGDTTAAAAGCQCWSFPVGDGRSQRSAQLVRRIRSRNVDQVEALFPVQCLFQRINCNNKDQKHIQGAHM